MTSSGLLEQLIARGLSKELAEKMVKQAVQSGEVQGGPAQAVAADLHGLPDEAHYEAVSVATALADSRTTTDDLLSTAQPGTARHQLYAREYPNSMEGAGIEGVELVERFPVLTGMYGYTRGNPAPGMARLVPFRRRGNRYVVYADVSETEALFVRLNPAQVAKWLSANGVSLPPWTDHRTARLAIIRSVRVPEPGQDPPSPATPGSLLLTLVHSIAHRMIRRVSVLAGIDRNAISEFLVPWHLSFFVYAAARGSFVLGGLQAMFDTELHVLLRDLVLAEHRCALDPGCTRAGAACAACLHLGETSCRWFNRFLDRRVLYGPAGFLVNSAGMQ